MASASASTKARHLSEAAPGAPSSGSGGSSATAPAPAFKPDRPRAASSYAFAPYDYYQQAGSSSSGSGGVMGSANGAYPQYSSIGTLDGSSSGLQGGEYTVAASNVAYPDNSYLAAPGPSQQQQQPLYPSYQKQEALAMDGSSWGDSLQAGLPYPSPSQEVYGYEYDPSFQTPMPLGQQPFHASSSVLPPSAHTPPQQPLRVLPPTGAPRPQPSPSKPKTKVPRPPNAWILYRSDKFARAKAGEEIVDISGKGKSGRGIPQSELSKTISKLWKAEPQEKKDYWEKLAQEKKLEHQKEYPDYKFQPKRKEEKQAEKAARELERENKKRSKDSRSMHRGASRRHRGRSPTGEGDYHPYHLGMARSSSYAGSSAHPPEHRAGEYSWNPSRLGYQMEALSESDNERKAAYPYPAGVPLGAMDMFPGIPPQKATPTGSPSKSYAPLPPSIPSQQEWVNPAPEPSPIHNFPPFSPFRPMEGQPELKGTTVPYIFKPINAQPIMLPAEYAPVSNEYLLDDEEMLASTWVDLAQTSSSTTPGNEQGFASFSFENMADADSWTTHENAHLPIPSNMISPNVREFIEKGWDAQKSSQDMYVGLPTDYDLPKEQGPVLPTLPLSPDAPGPSSWMSPTSALAGTRTFSDSFPGLDSQLLSWEGDSFNEADIPGALETLDLMPGGEGGGGVGAATGSVTESATASTSVTGAGSTSVTGAGSTSVAGTGAGTAASPPPSASAAADEQSVSGASSALSSLSSVA